ncbi:MAG TPA: formylglycine-generating enzyme family protein [Patescibacteria group bacterium]|nr:formylglycine-generating enzyme family protein [Patescibacteria group bacterium]
MNTPLQPVITRACGSLLLSFCAINAEAAAPSISSIMVAGANPRLNIVSDVGITNQIQMATNLFEPNWTVLTNFMVMQSNYWYLDDITSSGDQRFYRVVAIPVSNSNPGVPSGMVLIPAGTFQMGDTFNEGESYELPVHQVYVSAFYMDQFEVSKGLWDQVKNWSSSNGYTFDNDGAGKAADHPVQSINWYDMVKWCNARSEMQGRAPAYYTDASLTQVYKTGQVAPFVNWATGYRLPTEAEWEKGARGGASGHRFPWSDVDTITHSQANYFSDSSFSFDISPTRGYNPKFEDGVMPYTSPVGSFAPNGYGLYDMAGNVWEWCWDWAGNYSSAPVTDPRGPDTGSTRVGKGGNWNFYAGHCRASYRYGNVPTDSATNIGFRCAMPAQ